MAIEESPGEKTGFGKFLQKVGHIFPDILEVGATALLDSPAEAIRMVKDKLQGKAAQDGEHSIEASRLLLELKTQEYDFIKEMYSEDTKRIQSAHELEKVQLEQTDLFTKRARPARQYFWLIFLLLCYPLAKFTTGTTVDIPEIVMIGIFGDMGFYAFNGNNNVNTPKVKLNNILGKKPSKK